LPWLEAIFPANQYVVGESAGLRTYTSRTDPAPCVRRMASNRLAAFLSALDPAPDVLADDSDRVRGGDVRDDDDAGDDEGDPKPDPDALLAPPSLAARFLAVNDATPTPVEGRSAGVRAARPKQERAGSAAGRTKKALVVAAAARDGVGSSGASDVAKRAPSRGRRRRRGVDWIIVGREVAPRLLLAVAPRRRGPPSS
jgi:hypothetical protein